MNSPGVAPIQIGRQGGTLGAILGLAALPAARHSRIEGLNRSDYSKNYGDAAGRVGDHPRNNGNRRRFRHRTIARGGSSIAPGIRSTARPGRRRGEPGEGAERYRRTRRCDRSTLPHQSRMTEWPGCQGRTSSRSPTAAGRAGSFQRRAGPRLLGCRPATWRSMETDWRASSGRCHADAKAMSTRNRR